jgi:hypothetical protein
MTNPRTETWQIDSGETVSNAIHKQHLDLCGCLLPATLTGTNLSFQVSFEGTTYVALQWEGDAVSFAKTAGRALQWDPLKFRRWPYVKIVSDGAEGDDRAIQPILSDFGG